MLSMNPFAYPLRVVGGKPYWFITDLENTSTSGLQSTLANADSWELARFNGSDWVRNKIEFDVDNPNPGQPIANLNWWNESGKKVVNWWGIPERTVNADFNINADLFVFSEGEVILAPDFVISGSWGWHYPEEEGVQPFKALSILTWNWDDGSEVFLTRYNRIQKEVELEEGGTEIQWVWELIWTVSLGTDTINLASNFFANPSGTEARGVAVYELPVSSNSSLLQYQWSEPELESSPWDAQIGRETIINLDTGVVTTGYDDATDLVTWYEDFITEGFGHQRYPDGAKYFRYKVPVTSDDPTILIDDSASWVEVGDEYILDEAGSGNSNELIRTYPFTIFNPNHVGWIRIDSVQNFPLVDVTWILSPGFNDLFDWPEGALNWSINNTGKINIDGYRNQRTWLEGEYLYAIDYTKEGKVRKAFIEYYEEEDITHIYECFHNMVLEDESKTNQLSYTFLFNTTEDMKLRIETEGEPDIVIQLNDGIFTSTTQRTTLDYSPKDLSGPQRVSGWEWNPGVWPYEGDLEDIPEEQLPSDIIDLISYETDYTRHGCTLNIVESNSYEYSADYTWLIHLDLRQLVFIARFEGESSVFSNELIPYTEYARLNYIIGSFTQGDSHRRLSNIFMHNNTERDHREGSGTEIDKGQGWYMNFDQNYKEIDRNEEFSFSNPPSTFINQTGAVLGEKMFNGIVLDWDWSEPVPYGFGGWITGTLYPGSLNTSQYYSTAVSPNAAITDINMGTGASPFIFRHVASKNSDPLAPPDPEITPAQAFDEEHDNSAHIVRPIFFGYRKP